MPAYVALCDQKAIQCEETMLAIPMAVNNECLPLYEANGTCTPQCAQLANDLSSRCVCDSQLLVTICTAALVLLLWLHSCSKCFESVWSVQEAIAQAASQTCGDSGERARFAMVYMRSKL